MSCQQVSRLITTVASSVTPEDPYVFTETVPTAPPILFNTQKSRPRPTDTPQVITTIVAAAATKTYPNKKFTPAQLNANEGTKAQASFAAITAGSAAGTATTTTALASSKNVTQSQKQQQPQQQKQQWQQNKHIITTTTNVCIVRPQKQQQKQKQQPQHSPLPPLLPHTPSLWQTPLLLDTAPLPPIATAASAPISPHTTLNASLHTFPLSSLSPAPITQSTANAASTETITTTVVTAMVTPLVAPVPSPTVSGATLPPSKFHHTTLAQHLQKVQCLKKPKQKPNTNVASNAASIIIDYTKPQQLDLASAPALAAIVETPQHSSSANAAVSDDPNEIPVNVIFRKPQTQLTNAVVGQQQPQSPPTQPKLEKKPKINISKSPAAATATAQKLKKVKLIAPTIKATPPPQPLSILAAPQPVLPVLRDVFFVQPNAKHDVHILPPPSSPANETSSIVAVVAATPLRSQKNVKFEKSLQTEAQYDVVEAESQKTSAYKRKACATNKIHGAALQFSPYATQKKIRKSTFAALCTRNEHFMDGNNTAVNTTAVAVIKMSAAQVDADTSMLASESVLPYCVQQHWLGVYDVRTCSHFVGVASCSSSNINDTVLSPNIGREERIAQHKSLLRRQALQLLATRSLQKLPLQAARRRLICVDRLLRKYRNQNEEDRLPANVKKCIAPACTQHALEMAAHCQQHIAANATQHIFLPCTAKFADNTQCRIPVFDIMHDLPLCAEHARKRDAYNRSVAACEQRKSGGVQMASLAQPLPQVLHYEDELPQMQTFCNSNQNKNNNKISPNVNVAIKPAMPQQSRKRKIISGNPVGRPLKRAKKAVAVASVHTTQPHPPPPPPLSTVLQRKSSTTSLESIASTSHSSSLQSQQQLHCMPSTNVVASLAPPALAPLSGNNSGSSNRMLNFGTVAAPVSNVATVSASDLQTHEINQIVAQFAMVANNNNNNNIINNHSNHVHNNIGCNNNSQNYNMHQFVNTNSNSNFTLGFGSTSSSASSLPTTDELLTQDMLSICENSSYASSEDTGLGGLSDSELMAGAHDADEIPLADTRLLEEHDLANVLSTLPVDAFNELFTAVRQDECDAVERALELADKHLKSLQQTIGSDSDFLGDFLDVNDEILADASMEMVMHSPDTSGIDTSTLFIDSGSNSGTSAATVGADIRRGLVQT